MRTLDLDLKAATTLTDKGEVRLLVSTYDKDRGGDVIQRGAWASTIAAWKASKRNVPVLYDHKAESVIGHADPHTMRETDQGLEIEAKLFISPDEDGSERARDAWRAVKANALSVSFGYLADDRMLEDGTRLLTRIDLLEVTLTPSPMNPNARVLSHKGTANAHENPEPSADRVAMFHFFQRGPEEVVREYELRKGIEAKAAAEAEREARGPLQVASFDVETP
jgi:HK97 family phage prohead protease